MKFLVIFMLTIFTGENCLLLNPIEEFIEIEAWLHQAFSYVEKTSSIKEWMFY